jgi:hypothetical protein
MNGYPVGLPGGKINMDISKVYIVILTHQTFHPSKKNEQHSK